MTTRDVEQFPTTSPVMFFEGSGLAHLAGILLIGKKTYDDGSSRSDHPPEDRKDHYSNKGAHKERS